jgi:putative membrane protein
MKSYNTSFSPYRRALCVATVALAAGSVAAVAQSSTEAGSSTSPNSGSSSYQSDNSSRNANDSAYNNSASSSGANMSSDSSNNSNASSRDNSGKLSWSDRRFVTKASHDNQVEIQVAQLATQRASNPDVKNFAQRLVDDHTQLGQQMQQLASTKGITLKEENKEDREDKKLSKLSGSDFDREFVKRMVAEHKKDLKEFKDRADDSKDPELKALVQATVPKLQQHLQIAQQLEQSIVPTGLSGNESWKSSSSSATGSNSAQSSTSGAASSGSSSSAPNAISTGSISGSNASSSSNTSSTNTSSR